MKKSLMTAGIALALGVVWTAGPAFAQSTTGEKIEDKAKKAGDKMERAADKTGEKLHKAADKTEDKAEGAWDKTKDKAHDVKETVKEKAVEIKDKVKAKTTDKMKATTEKADVMAMQRALKDKGFDPGPMDGRMGPRTKSALMDFQRKEGMTPTGRWDEQTMDKLGVRTSAAKPDTMTPSASPATSMPTQATPPGVSTPPPATPEDKTAAPAKRTAP
jgi:murein L,D-transpeptidase YcbB/YkuD